MQTTNRTELLKTNGQLGPSANVLAIRGLACLSVVVFHCVGSSSQTGARLVNGNFWFYCMNSLSLIRMPLFTIIAGLLYAYRPVNHINFNNFLKTKFTRLLFPLLATTSLYWVIRRFAGLPVETIVNSYLHGVGHLWYLYSILTLFLSVAGINYFWRASVAWQVPLALSAMALSVAYPDIRLFAISNTFYLCPYFMFGMIISRHNFDETAENLKVAVLALTIYSLIVQQLGLWGLSSAVSKTSVTALVCGCSSSMLLLIYFPRVRILEAIGKVSFPIYLWHPMVVSATRRVFESTSLKNSLFVAVACVIMGLILPIMLTSRWRQLSENRAINQKITHMVLLGLRLIQSQKATAVASDTAERKLAAS